MSTVHPHVRGEYAGVERDPNLGAGSSPRAWGIRASDLLALARKRFIPTCVGNTVARMRRDTPRRGSSPRAWGIQRVEQERKQNLRFIPTCVGNTHYHRRIPYHLLVHPHVRGEYQFNEPETCPSTGSSPRAWGILTMRRRKSLRKRFIPTCVGNTYKPTNCPRKNPVHPHVRGEYNATGQRHSRAKGSSPRAWGILGQPRPCFLLLRFIPTCVGNTCLEDVQDGLCSVHPHVRGEYTSADHYQKSWCGSSPRAWGIPHKAKSSA